MSSHTEAHVSFVPEHLLSPRLMVVAGILLLVLAVGSFGNASKTSSSLPRLGTGLLMPWLRWETADRCRQEEYEREGYQKYGKKGQPFVVTTFAKDNIVMPLKYLNTVKKTDRHVLNFAHHMDDGMHVGKMIGDILVANDLGSDLVSRNINLKMDTIVELLADEANHYFSNDIGDLSDFKPFKAFALAENMILRVSGRLFVGPETCRDPEYIKRSGRYSMTMMIGAVIWNFLPWGARQLAYWSFCPIFGLYARHCINYILPAIRERKAQREANEAEEDRPVDIVQFSVDQNPTAPGEDEDYRHASRIIHLSSAGTGTMMGVLYFMFWRILLHPEYLPKLREEFEAAMKASRGVMEKKMLDSLPLMDSFAREVIRHHPPACFFVQRTAMQPFTFPDGFTLEKGSRIAFPVVSTNLDPDHYKDAAEFDGFRFAGPEYSARFEEKVSAAVANEKFLSFGYGPQACPGRFLAVRLLKILFGSLICKYDIDWASEKKTLPPRSTLEGMFLPAMDAQIRLKSRA